MAKIVVTKLPVHELETWPPGSWIRYYNTILKRAFIGIVVSNDRTFIEVLWSPPAQETFKVYHIANLNHAVIDRVEIG